MHSLGPDTMDNPGALLGPSGSAPQCRGAGLRGATWPQCARVPRAAGLASCFSLESCSSIFFTMLRGNQKVVDLSWRSREEGRDLLPPRSGPAGFLWCLRHPALHWTRPISSGLSPGSRQVRPSGQGVRVWKPWQRREGQSLWRGRAEPNPRGTHPCPRLPLFCLRTPPWGWKAGLTQGHSCRTSLLSCHPAVSTDSPSRVLLPGQGRRMCSRPMPPMLGDIYQWSCFEAVASSLLNSTFLLHTSWRDLYGSSSARTCLARGGLMLQRQGQIPSHTLPWPLLAGWGCPETLGIRAEPGHACVRGNRDPNPADRRSLPLDSRQPCRELPHTYSGCGVSSQGAGIFTFSARGWQ